MCTKALATVQRQLQGEVHLATVTSVFAAVSITCGSFTHPPIPSLFIPLSTESSLSQELIAVILFHV